MARQRESTIVIDGHELTVSYLHTEGTSASLVGHPDTWYPAEGDEYDIQTVYLNRGGRQRQLSRQLEDNLYTQMCEELQAAW